MFNTMHYAHKCSKSAGAEMLTISVPNEGNVGKKREAIDTSSEDSGEYY